MKYFALRLCPLMVYRADFKKGNKNEQGFQLLQNLIFLMRSELNINSFVITEDDIIYATSSCNVVIDDYDEEVHM